MANKDVLNNLLQPVNPADNARWREFLNGVREDILWKPHFDGALIDFDHSFGNIGGELDEPSAQIWTCILPRPEVNTLLNEGFLQEFFDRDIFLLDYMELKPRNWDYASLVDPRFMSGRERVCIAKFVGNEPLVNELRVAQNQIIQEIQQQNAGRLAQYLLPPNIDTILDRIENQPHMALTGKIFLCRIRHEGFVKETERDVIFAFIQDTVFLKVFIIEGGLEVGAVV